MNTLLPLVLINGLIDSINPCAITVLLLFIGLMFSLQKSRQAILLMGFFYILSVYITYFLIGLGVLKIVHLFGVMHFMAYIGVSALLLVGLINLKDYFLPNFLPKINLRISLGSRQLISEWAFKASIPAIMVVGILVGVTEFPCSGAIYFAVLGLLSIKTTFWQGFIYLLLYNVMFILPLVVIYLVASNRLVVEKMINFSESLGRKSQLIMGLIMLALVILILVMI